MGRISTKALRDMKDAYSLRIKRSRDSIESKLKNEKRIIENEHYNSLCIEITDLLRSRGIDVATVSHISIHTPGKGVTTNLPDPVKDDIECSVD